MDSEFFFTTVTAPAPAARDGEIGIVFGKANYSYALAMRKFMQAFDECGSGGRQVSFPAMVPNARSLLTDPAARAVHLGFYPPEELRLMKGARNILLFVWEFSVLRTDEMIVDTHAFASQTKMLSTVDSIWTASHYSAQVLQRSTQTRIAVIPAPIQTSLSRVLPRLQRRPDRKRAQFEQLARLTFVPLAIFPRFQSETSRAVSEQPIDRRGWTGWIDGQNGEAVVFLTVLNPHDARKGLKDAVEAFCRVADRFPNAVWIIKTSSHDDDQSTINTRIMTHQIAREHELAGQYFCARIWVTNQILTADEMSALYELSDFYICVSHAEGQNFPLQEAMGCGVVPVSADHTAMADYVSSNNAVPIASAEVPLPASAARKYGLAGASWFQCEPVDVYRSLCDAMTMSPQRYAELSYRAYQTIEQNYSGPVVVKKAFEALA